MKVDILASLYIDGGYDGAACQPTALEQTSFAAKSSAGGGAVTVAAALHTAITVNGDKVMLPRRPRTETAAEMSSWFKNCMAPSTAGFIDYTFAVPYSLDTGNSS